MRAGIIFHHFVGRGHPHIQGALTAEDLEQLILSLGPDRFLVPERWIELSLDGKLPCDALCLTFDDGLASQVDIAVPVLDKFGMRAFFFLYSAVLAGEPEPFEVHRYFRNLHYPSVDAFYAEFYEAADEITPGLRLRHVSSSEEAGRYLGSYAFYSESDRRFRYVRDRILPKNILATIMESLMHRHGTSPESLSRGIWINNEMARGLAAGGHIIGLHSHTHPTNMTLLPIEEQYKEYRRNLDHLSSLLGTAPQSMAHPSGSYNGDTLEILREMGVQIGFRSDNDSRFQTLLEMPRLDHVMLKNLQA